MLVPQPSQLILQIRWPALLSLDPNYLLVKNSCFMRKCSHQVTSYINPGTQYLAAQMQLMECSLFIHKHGGIGMTEQRKEGGKKNEMRNKSQHNVEITIIHKLSSIHFSKPFLPL